MSEELNFKELKNSFRADMPKETICTCIIIIPNGLQGSVEEINEHLRESYSRIVNFIGLSHMEIGGFNEKQANLLCCDYKISKKNLDTIEEFCKELDVIPLSFYMRYADLEENNSYCLGKIVIQ